MIKVIGPVRLGSEPVLEEFPDGTPYVRFSAASNESWKDKQTGERRERTAWLRCLVTGARAEVIANWVHKTDELYIEGTLVPDDETGGPKIWFDSDGEPRSSYEVRVSDFQFIGPKSEGSGDSGGSRKSKKSKPQAEDDEIPW